MMKRYLSWLICFFLLRGLAYILITPPWQAPDETTHFQFMALLTERSLSEIRRIEQKSVDQDYVELERRILESMKQHEAWKHMNLSAPDPLPQRFRDAPFFSGSPPKIYRPPLYYLIGAELLRLFKPEHVETKLYIARFYSLILALGTVIVSYSIGFLIFQDKRYALMIGTFVSCLPQFMVIGTSVNSDNLVNLLVSGFLAYAVFLIRNQKRDLYLLPLPFFLLATFLSGKTGVIMVPIAILLYLHRIKRSMEFWTVLILTLMIATSFFFFIQHLWSGMVARTYQILKVSYESIPFGLERGWEFYRLFLIILFKSFWFVGGWMAIYWNRWIYLFLTVLSISSAIGYSLYLFDRFIRRKKETPRSSLIFFLMTFAALLTFGTCLLYNGFVIGMLAQGRYLFSVLPAFAVLFLIGLKTLCPKRIVSYFPHAFMVLMVCLDVYALFGCLLPYFHLR